MPFKQNKHKKKPRIQSSYQFNIVDKKVKINRKSKKYRLRPSSKYRLNETTYNHYRSDANYVNDHLNILNETYNNYWDNPMPFIKGENISYSNIDEESFNFVNHKSKQPPKQKGQKHEKKLSKGQKKYTKKARKFHNHNKSGHY